MEVALEADLDVSVEAVVAEVGNLEGYPAWLGGVVQKVVVDGDAWAVDLGAKLGPFRRSKTVRMVRAPAGDGEVRFVREELDGRDHGGWELVALVTAAEGASGASVARLRMRLEYDGSSPLVSLLEPVVRVEAGRAAERLRRRLEG